MDKEALIIMLQDKVRYHDDALDITISVGTLKEVIKHLQK